MDRSVCSKHGWAYYQGDCPDCAEEALESLRAEVERLRGFVQSEADNDCSCDCCEVARGEARALLKGGE